MHVAAEAIDALTGELAGHLGATGLVALVVLLILTGRLVPGRERDYWRDIAIELSHQNRELMEGAKVSQDVMRALPDAMPQSLDSLPEPLADRKRR